MHLPHLQPFSKQPLYFITTCTAGRRSILAADNPKSILAEIWTKSAPIDGWHVGHFLLMPDHVHLFAMPTIEAKPPAVWMKGWKSISSRQIAASSQSIPPIWQADYFDHFVRSVAAYRQKWDYVQDNPVRKGLCRSCADWPYQGTLSDMDPRVAG